MVFNTNQMPLLTTFAKVRGKKDMRWMAWPFALCRANWGVCPTRPRTTASLQLDSRGRLSNLTVDHGIPTIGRLWSSAASVLTQRGLDSLMGPPRPPRGPHHGRVAADGLLPTRGCQR
jgi:hypothetical protein